MTNLFIFNGLLEVLLATVVLRAEASRRENQLLALTALLDASRVFAIAFLLLRGYGVADAVTLRVCLIGRILVMCPVLELTYAFPSGARPPFWVRGTALGASALATLAALHPATTAWTASWQFEFAFFSPFFAATVLVARRNLASIRAERGAGEERTFLTALIVRFAVALTTCIAVRPFFPEVFPTIVMLDGIVAVASSGVAAHFVLKYRFFRAGGLVAEALVYGALWLTCLGLVVACTDFVAQNVREPLMRGLAFSGLMFIPLGTWRLMLRCAPLLESALVYPFDARRRSFKAMLERVRLESLALCDAAALCELTSNALATLSRGTVVLWRVAPSADNGWRHNLSGPVLPRELADYLERSPVPTLHRRSLSDPAFVQAFTVSGADAVVAVRAQGKLLCAFTIRSRFIGQDLLDAASALADNLGNKLVHQAMREYASDLQSQLEASRRLSTLGSIAAAIAHDIRTPLTSVRMNLEMIRDFEGLDADMRESAEIALEELDRMKDYVSGMLDYVKPVQLRAVEFEIELLIDECVRTLQPSFDSRKLELRWKHNHDQPPLSVRADVSRMKQVLLNLLENAADASAVGQSIEISVARLGSSHLAIRIIDHGHGIEPGHLDRIFEPFFTTREDGTGLGLAIVNKLVRAHEGEVQAESVPGGGSTFSVVLPTCGVSQAGLFPLRSARELGSSTEFGSAEVGAAE